MTAPDLSSNIAHDVAAVQQISAVPGMLKLVCKATGMGFAAVARVTAGSWTACSVHDEICFGLKPGDQLDIQTTLCAESRLARQPIIIAHAQRDPVYGEHPTPLIYGFESYISVPIILSDDQYFGNLCAIDPQPRSIAGIETAAMFQAYAALIAHQLENELRHTRTEQALADERTNSELREQFIAVLGHDLRSPLSAVANAAELLVRQGPNVDASRLGQRIKASTKRMSGLISDLMDFARGRLGSGMLLNRIEAGPEQVIAAMEGVVDELQESLPDRRLVQKLSIPCPVVCDLGRLQQLAANLLSNACTHGAADQPIALDVSVRKDVLEVSVQNGGEPIAPADLARIFEPYWRSETSHAGGGLGLGLHICSQIVKAHGGILTVASTARYGTRFVARLPTGATA